MKPDERTFFLACLMLKMNDIMTIRDVVNMFAGVIHHKRCWYLLEKWCDLGFYDYGVTMDLGWFYIEKLPDRYSKLLIEI